MESYREANKIDRMIGSLLIEHRIIGDNLRDWRLFVRVIRTTLDIIENMLEVKAEEENDKALQRKKIK